MHSLLGRLISTEQELAPCKNALTSLLANSLEKPSHEKDNLCLIWSKACTAIAKEIDKQIFSAWIEPLSIASLDFLAEKSARVVIDCPNKFCGQHVKQNYAHVIASSLSEVLIVDSITLAFKVKKDRKEEKKTSLNVIDANAKPVQSDKPVHKKEFDSSNLNPKYTFSNFVVGTCNQFAAAVSLKVAESPGEIYNPLFLYGGVGLGKTHLVNAIGNRAKKNRKKILLLSSETFVTELITAIRSNHMDQFRNRMRSVDMLIIDDIQFIIGKERTQEEFFHTFNELYNRKKQIIITSDKVPQQLVGLEERLKTRFASGLSADLQVPDFETRVAILSKKAEKNKLPLPSSVAELIAQRINSNIRELEGALNRLQASCSLHNKEPDIEIAQEVVHSLAPIKRVDISTEVIQKTIASKYGISLSDLLGKKRTSNVAFARHIAMYLCRKLTSCSYPEIGALFGGRDHATAIHAHKIISGKTVSDISLKKEIDDLEKSLMC